jgi:DUF4097 and DUF4098 domain-containing protein YvlB
MDKLTTIFAPVVVSLCSLTCHAALGADFCRSTAERSATIDAADATKIVIGAGAGDLVVRGDHAARSVSATGHVCASSDKLLEQVQIKTRREGAILYLNTVLPDSDSGFPWLLNNATLDLTVTLPASLAVEVADSSGDVDLRQVRAAKLEDSSGDIEVSGIAGDVTVSDSSGDVDIEHVTGTVKIERDSSGDVDIQDVRGDVNVLIDSSGTLQIERVAGSVHVGQDSSGDIVIREVKGDARVDSDSSGDIRVVQVGGNFSVESDSSGDISHDRIEGNVRLPGDRDKDR